MTLHIHDLLKMTLVHGLPPPSLPQVLRASSKSCTVHWSLHFLWVYQPSVFTSVPTLPGSDGYISRPLALQLPQILSTTVLLPQSRTPSPNPILQSILSIVSIKRKSNKAGSLIPLQIHDLQPLLQSQQNLWYKRFIVHQSYSVLLGDHVKPSLSCSKAPYSTSAPSNFNI